jgi:phosphatidylserine/phosphatidylglycerophosphate/cardiolipin synthase-like enzyme
VRVLLEGNVYNTPRINDEKIKSLRLAGIPVEYTWDRYTFTHMKLWLLDDTWCVSTGNWSYTTFTKNREFTFCSEDAMMLKDMEEIFRSDERHARPYFPDGLDSRIGISPDTMRPYLQRHLREAQKSIIVYNQSITDDDILDTLIKRSKDGVRVELCQSNRSPIQTGHLLPIRIVEKPYLHAKIFLIDDERVIL